MHLEAKLPRKVGMEDWGVQVNYVVATASFVVLGIPLMLGKVGPNRWYGVRFRATLEDPTIWYAVNKRAGQDMTISGTICLVFALGGQSLGVPFAAYLLTCSLALVVATLIMAIRAYRLSKCLWKERHG